MGCSLEIAQKIKKDPHKLGHFLGYDKLTELHSEWIKAIYFNRINEHCLKAHRGSYKTTSLLVLGVILYLMFNPDNTVLICRKTVTGASKVLGEIAQHLKGAGVKALVSSLYGVDDYKLILENKEKLTHSLKGKVSKEASVEAIGIGGAITGDHFDLIIADDIVTLKDRVSKAERETTKLYVQELRNIVKPEGKIVFLGTTWHKDDAFTLMPEPMVYTVYDTGLPEYNEKKVSELKQRMTKSLFDANYLLKHTSDDSLIFPDATYTKWVGCRTIAYLDPAYGGKDTTALTIIGKVKDRYQIYGKVWDQSVDELYETISKECKGKGVETIYVEKNADKGLSKAPLMQFFPDVRTIHESVNKHQRIITYAKYYWPDIDFDYDTDDSYMSQVLDYVEGEEPDDCPDSLAGAVRQYLRDIEEMGEAAVQIQVLQDTFRI